MPSINKVQLIGNVTADTTLKMTKSGKKVTNFTIATNEQWKNPEGQVMRNANFHKAVAWNGLADFASKVCNKGRLMYIEGKLVNHDYKNEKGEKKYVTEVVVSGLKPLDYGKKEDEETTSDELPTENMEVEIVEDGELVAA
ncbi:MAG: single-stranded DNA-binding protein [Candidatus Peregrinibacteria bacterium]|nr:single-stranded DNA-binding protein [Candidatus Peregrinibacteria bacterium]MDZ4245089.1 single-stranded DNA-binding protein [Candidatus Gracilibacteria bacterium]